MYIVCCQNAHAGINQTTALCHTERLPGCEVEGVNEGALYHHERYDGKGYPKGLAGKDIPQIARMICLADSFDAMNSNRVYRNKLTKENIISEIESNKGRQFDPEIADVMLKLLRDPDNRFDF